MSESYIKFIYYKVNSIIQQVDEKSPQKFHQLEKKLSGMNTMTIKTEIKNACKNHNFVGIVCIDGHEHTVKAFGEICGTPFELEDELENQLNYCTDIAQGYDVEILTADSFEEAIENDIVEENGYIK